MRALADAPDAFSTTYGEARHWPPTRWEAQVTEFATFVAVAGERDVGVARGAAHRSDPMRELVSLWVDPSVRRTGVATKLVESVAAWATAAGAALLVLEVVASNAPAIALYMRTGFLPFGGDNAGERAPGEARFVRALRM